jgi:hypothetical protein
MSQPRHQQRTRDEEVTREDEASNSDQEDRKQPALDHGNERGDVDIILYPQEHQSGCELDGEKPISESSHIISSFNRTPRDILCGELGSSLEDLCCSVLWR